MKWHQNRAGPEGETIICNSSTGHCDTDKHIVTRSAGGCKLIVQRLEYRDAGAVICEVWISQRLYRRTAALLVFSKLCPIIFTLVMNYLEAEMADV